VLIEPGRQSGCQVVTVLLVDSLSGRPDQVAEDGGASVVVGDAGHRGAATGRNWSLLRQT
jgi:hypothetical protein